MLKFNEEKQIKQIETLHRKEEEELAKILSSKYEVSYIDLSTVSINTNALRLVDEKEARKNKVASFDVFRNKVKLAVLSPAHKDTQESILKLQKQNFEISLYMVSNQSLEKAWDRYKDLSFSTKTEEGVLSIEGGIVSNLIEETKSIEEIKELLSSILNGRDTNRISRFFDVILASSLSLEASDIHIEPEEEFTRLRFRLDGILTNIIEFDKKTYSLMLSRIKLIAGLKLNILDNSQDGRLSIKIGGSEIEIRVSTMPGAYGESVVLRILNPDAISVPIEELGIEPNLLRILMKEMSKPNGMILNTGPTGSGKTTTLYAFLNKVHSPDIKIITIEDPIEYHLKGITQTQTNSEKGYTFAQGLRSALRQDPDIIMVGEIRDTETAEIAINSALTGHLVLSTLHTNTAAGTFPRFIDLGINPKILSSAINATMAQRLVRKLCKTCKKEILIEGDDKITIDRIVGNIKDRKKYRIKSLDNHYLPVGCKECNFTGYKGRIGIFDAVIMDETIEQLLKENPSEREIQEVAKNQGILNMKQDGIIKVLNGDTSLVELRRIIELE